MSNGWVLVAMSLALLLFYQGGTKPLVGDVEWHHQCFPSLCRPNCPTFCYVDTCKSQQQQQQQPQQQQQQQQQHNSTCDISRRTCWQEADTGEWKCLCKDGFVGTDCHDLDECVSDIGQVCHPNAHCTNYAGNYTCECDVGYEGDGIQCAEVCPSAISMKCNAPHEVCQMIDKEWKCACRPGFTGPLCQRRMYTGCGGRVNSTLAQIRYPYKLPHEVWHDCTWFIDTNNVPIVLQFRHFNFSPDKTSCSGFVKFDDRLVYCVEPPPWWRARSGKATLKYHQNTSPLKEASFTVNIDVDVCHLGRHNCSLDTSYCMMNHGEHLCVCRRGFVKLNNTCVDINECEKPSHNCHNNATCHNTQGSYTCTCNDGFVGDGRKCTEHCPSAVQETCDVTKEICMRDEDGTWLCVCRNNYTEGLNSTQHNACTRMVYTRCGALTSLSNIVITYNYSAVVQPAPEKCVWQVQADVPLYIRFTKFNTEQGRMSTSSQRRQYCNKVHQGNSPRDDGILQQLHHNEIPPSESSRDGTFYLSFCEGSVVIQGGVCNPVHSYVSSFEVVISTDVCLMVKCHPKAVCSNHGGVAVCKCLFGYSGNGFHCKPTKCHTCEAYSYTKEDACRASYANMFINVYRVPSRWKCASICLSVRRCSMFVFTWAAPGSFICSLLGRSSTVQPICSQPGSTLGRHCEEDLDCSKDDLEFRVMAFNTSLNHTSWKMASTHEVRRSIHNAKAALAKNNDIICHLSDGSFSRIGNKYDIDRYHSVVPRFKLVFRIRSHTAVLTLTKPPGKSFNILACMLGLLILLLILTLTVVCARRISKKRNAHSRHIAYNVSNENLPGILDSIALRDARISGNIQVVNGQSVFVPIGAPPVYSPYAEDDEDAELMGVGVSGLSDVPPSYTSIYASHCGENDIANQSGDDEEEEAGCTFAPSRDRAVHYLPSYDEAMNS